MNDYPIVTDENGVPRAPVPPSLVTVTRVVYALHALSILIGVFTGASIATAFVFGWPSIIAVIINYVERSDVRGTYLDSHFSWQIRTFWYALLWIVIVWILGLALAVFLVETEDVGATHATDAVYDAAGSSFFLALFLHEAPHKVLGCAILLLLGQIQ